MSGSLRFLSHLRLGLATRLTGSPSVPNAQAPYSLSVAGVEMAGQFRLFGPGEVVALDPGQVVRSFPPPASRDHEPNLFAHVELRSADLPWRFTPGGAAAGKLRPWLVLVVVEASDRVRLQPRGTRLPVLTTPVSELPDLAESWAWAHVQVTLDSAGGGDLQALHDKEPERFVARLICPRKLEARKNYLACLVPAFDAGRDAGLGISAAERPALGNAWTADMSEVSLPVYHSWTFACASRGDFEYLAEQLRPRPAPDDLGVADLDVAAPGLGLPGVDEPLPMTGALCSPGARSRMAATPGRAENALRGALWKVVSDGATLPMPAGADDPIVAPPMYGAVQAGAAGAAPPWQLALNRQPGYRAIAGLGAEVIRRNQEELAAAAWEKLEAIASLEQTLRRDALKEAANVRQRQRLAPLGHGEAGDYLVFARPMCATVASGDKSFLRRLREDADVPSQVAAPATARLAVRAGRVRRRRLLDAPTAAGMTRACLTAEKRPDFAPAPGPGSRTAARAMQRVDTSALKSLADASARKAIADHPAAVGKKPLAMHPGKGRVPAPPAPPAFRGGAGIGKHLWEATEPAAFLRARRRGLVSADADLAALGPSAKGPLPTRLLPALEFRSPFGAALARMAPEYILPRVGKVASNSISVVEVNTAFIEAFLAGANDEWARELVWRELPAAPRATSMRRFWDCEDPGDQIPALGQWSRTGALGGNATRLAGGSGLAMLVKGRLLDRYPDTLVYAVRASWSDGRRLPVKAPTAREILWPDVTGQLGPGVRFFLFFELGARECSGAALTGLNPAAPGNADPGWFFALEEQACAPRFGLDVAASGAPPAIGRWDELTWGHVSTGPAKSTSAPHLTLAPPRGVQSAGEAVWAAGSADMAWITLQTPFRAYIHGSSMLAG